MYRNPNDFSHYSDMAHETDYTSPGYYQQEVPTHPSRSAEPVQFLDPYADYPTSFSDSSAIKDDTSQLGEYRGPANIDGYTTDVGAEQRNAAVHGESDRSRKRKGWIGFGGLLTTIGALLLKFKALVFLVKFAPAIISAIVSIVVYSFFLGWPFAVGLVALLFLHEMGHAVVMKLKGIPVGGMIFIPMLGAAVLMRQMPQNARDEAEVGIAGPIAGAIASSVCLVLAEMNPTAHIWAPLAYFGFFMNLFNLIPIVPFDGGRVLAAIDRRIWIIGFIGLLGYQIWLWLNGNFSFWLLFFIFMAATQLWSRGRVPDTAEAQAYYKVPTSTRIVLSLLYFGLAAVLVLGMSISHALISPML